MRKRLSSIVVALSIMAFFASAIEAVELPSIFSDHMVIQREVNAPVWGRSKPGTKATVEFAGKKKTAVAGADGMWMVKLDAMKANANPQTMIISDSDGVIQFTDVLVGDNWLCSGQSNMVFGLEVTANSQLELSNVSKYPTLRFFRVSSNISSETPQLNVPGKWDTLNATSACPLSAVGYFFGRRLNAELNIPIGLIMSAWSGTQIEPWITYTGWEKDFLKQVSAWLPVAKAAVDAGKPMPPTPVMYDPKPNGGIYNGLIAPLTPYGIKGAIWYQGESNGEECISYFFKMHALISGWRRAFRAGDFPFYYVQLAGYTNPSPSPEGGDNWARVREAQRKALEIPNTGMASAIDLANADNPNEIHPSNKQDVGYRLAQWALYQTYGKKNLVPSGPLFKTLVIEGNKIRVSFDYTGSGLMAGKKDGLEPTKEIIGGKLAGFAVSGADKKWAWADAVIDGNSVVISSNEVANPVAVRYAFSGNPQGANLYNKEGMPASPFRSDNW